jgi:hypothetical protein
VTDYFKLKAFLNSPQMAAKYFANCFAVIKIIFEHLKKSK